mmetsp:Transcript_55855/g.86818  ORF Transcript_55855/g.86818 Transcript_55855/m.86818 type:complete len:970 (-) Transcript_55855:191-3100(-)
MHCIAGAGHAIGHAAHYLGEPEFDGAAFGSGAFFANRVNDVSQVFEREIAAIDYKATRQQLHREDIRDLIELTTKRMDIYHLVGTLLLAFVMGWYTDGTIWDLPVWFSDLFIISNFSAVGYLTMTVWMAMHAAVAARSIGTRLLTSYARLSLPTRQELDAIRAPVFGKPLTNVKDFMKRKIWGGPSSDADLKAFMGIYPGQPAVVMFEPGKAGEDIGITFDKKEKNKVVAVREKSQAHRKGVRVGWRITAVEDHAFQSGKFQKVQNSGEPYEVTFDQDQVVVTFKPDSPPGFSVEGDTVTKIQPGSQAEEQGVRVGWRITEYGRNTYQESSGNVAHDGTSSYEITFDQAVQYVESEDHNQHFRVFLEQLPQWLVYDTWSRVCLSFGMNQLLQALSYFSLATLWTKSPMIAIMSFTAVNFLSHIVLWIDSGDVKREWHDEISVLALHVLPASSAVILIVAQAMFPHLVTGERYFESILVILCFFLHGCWLWYLAKTLFANAGDKAGKFQPATFANVLEWIPESKKVLKQHHSFKGLRRDSSTKSLPHSVSDVKASKKSVKGTEESGDDEEEGKPEDYDCCGMVDDEEEEERTQKTAAELASEAVAREVNGGPAPGKWYQTNRKHHDTNVDFTSSKHLPVKILRLFTKATIGWWLIAGLAHSLIISFDGFNRLKDFTGSNNMAPLRKKFIQWPQPHSLFQVSALYCDSSQVLVNSGFSVYSMSENSNMTREALKFVKEGNFGSVICGAHRCNTLSPPDNGQTSWVLGPLQPVSGGETPVTLPRKWRQVAGAWMDCPASAEAACAYGKIAGWDGAKVFVASLLRSTLDKGWRAHPEFEVDPAVGLCADHPKACDDSRQKYDDVRALHLSESGQVLMVLGRGFVDVWDLSKGEVAQRLQLDSNFTSMCQSGKDIYLSREDGSSPIMETTGLPRGIIELLQRPSTKPLALSQNVVSASTLTMNEPSKRPQRLRH